MRSLPLLRFLALVALAFLLFFGTMPGCGRTSLEPESLADASTIPACGPTNCPDGCCDANGACRTGRDVRACGSIGSRCADCIADGFALCDGSRVCGRDDPNCSGATCKGCCAVDEGRRRCLSGTQPAACGKSGQQCSNCNSEGRVCDSAAGACGTSTCKPGSCSGCCVGDKCLTGAIEASCGSGGTQCETCSPGQKCTGDIAGGGTCTGTASCGPANCAGCCSSSGQCLDGHDNTACGKDGVTCDTCGFDQTCVPDGRANARTCQGRTSCNEATCAGCCVGDQCVIQTTPQACGAKGDTCVTCGAGEICSAGGTCTATNSACNPSNCPGCCVGDICAFGQQDTACGAGGGLCANCVNQNRVCENATCQITSCSKENCPTGCCSGNTCVVGDQDVACGLPGTTCNDCTTSKQTCQGRQCRAACGPGTCSGCCRPDGTCENLVSSAACGSGGVACADCTLTNSFCNGLVVPRRCNDQQSTCPATYGGCAPGTTMAAIPAKQGVCDDGSLDKLAGNCTSGPEAPACVQTLGAVSPACSTCLHPFAVPFELHSGLWHCAASFVGGPCRRALGCANDCTTTSCGNCLQSSETQCFNLVTGPTNACGASYLTANACTADDLDPGTLCSQFSYPDFGQWFRSVGDHFCGNGP